MFNLICDRKGISMMEVLVSVSLVSIGIVALLTLLPAGWRLSNTSDLLGQAAGILQAELEANEIFIMNENNSVTPTPPGNPPVKLVRRSGKDTPQPGDFIYSVHTERENLGASWRVRVQVTWPANLVGISESVIVTRQRAFIQ